MPRAVILRLVVDVVSGEVRRLDAAVAVVEKGVTLLVARLIRSMGSPFHGVLADEVPPSMDEEVGYLDADGAVKGDNEHGGDGQRDDCVHSGQCV